MARAWNGIIIDGVLYSHIHVTDIKRKGQVLDGEHAQRAKYGNMVRDIIGTYYNYTITIDSDEAERAEYDSFYEVITAPVDSHTVVMPYGQRILEYAAYISNASDEALFIDDDGVSWGHLTIDFVAMSPQRR